MATVSVTPTEMDGADLPQASDNDRSAVHSTSHVHQQHAPKHSDAAIARAPAPGSTRPAEEQPTGTENAAGAPTSAPVPAVASKSMDLWDVDQEPAPRPGRPTRSLNVQQEPIGAYFDGGEGYRDDKPCAKHEPEGAPPTMTGRYKRLHAMYERVYGCRAPLAEL